MSSIGHPSGNFNPQNNSIAEEFKFDEFESLFDFEQNDSTHSLIGTDEDDTLTIQGEVHYINGNDGNDTVVFDFASTDVTALVFDEDDVMLFTDAKHYRIEEVESFQFADTTISVGELSTHFETEIVDDFDVLDDDHFEFNGKVIKGTEGDDNLVAQAETRLIDGKAGNDTVTFDFNSSAVEAIWVKENFVMLFTEDNEIKIENIENYAFTDDTFTKDALEDAFSEVLIDAPSEFFGEGFGFHKGHERDDFIDGGDGEDTVVFDLASTEVEKVIKDGEHIVFITPNGVDTFKNIELFQFSDQTFALADLATAFSESYEVLDNSSGLIDDEADEVGTNDDDVFDASETEDEASLDFDLDDLQDLSNHNGMITLITDEGLSFFREVEKFKFNGEKYFFLEDLIFGTDEDESLEGSNEDDVISAGEGKDDINAGEGDDLILNAEVGELIDGGLGLDTVKFLFDQLGITGARRKIDGSIEIETESGFSTLKGIEQIGFGNDDIIDMESFIAGKNFGKPVFLVPDGNGGTIEATPEVYQGGVDFLEFELLGDENGNVISGAATNDFINVGDGDDAASGGDGQDVLDGGTGSNFLTGGNGNDTFFLDGRSGSTTWSTVTDFDGDNVNIWGWIEGVSQLIASDDNAGAEGFKGATFHFDLNNDGNIDTSVTFSGLALQDVPEGAANTVEENGYLLFA